MRDGLLNIFPDIGLLDDKHGTLGFITVVQALGRLELHSSLTSPHRKNRDNEPYDLQNDRKVMSRPEIARSDLFRYNALNCFVQIRTYLLVLRILSTEFRRTRVTRLGYLSEHYAQQNFEFRSGPCVSILTFDPNGVPCYALLHSLGD